MRNMFKQVAYLDGEYAYSQGYAYDCNPFDQGDSQYRRWSEGWLDAENRHVSKSAAQYATMASIYGEPNPWQ